MRYFEAAVRAVQEIASPKSIAWAATVPGNRPIWQTFEFETPNLPRRDLSFMATPFTARTLETLVMPPAAGRLFGTRDTGPCGGVVITTEAARELGGDSVIGRSIETPDGWADIVGVVDVRDDAMPRVFHYVPGDEEVIAPPAMATYRAPQLTPAETTVLDVNIVSANYFEVMGFPLLDGRSFAADDRSVPRRDRQQAGRRSLLQRQRRRRSHHRSSRPAHEHHRRRRCRESPRRRADRAARRLLSDAAGLPLPHDADRRDQRDQRCDARAVASTHGADPRRPGGSHHRQDAG